MPTSPPPRNPAPGADHPLARAFRSFTEAAGSLERTYGQLQHQVTTLRQELEVTNRSLTVSLEENRRMRERLRCIVESLPCGVLVVEGRNQISMLNPEGSRLLGGQPNTMDALPPALAAALESARESEEEREIELAAGAGSSRWAAIRHAWLESNKSARSSVFILRDTSAAKQMEVERENLGKRQALVEMSALLAHEIRNPLGSLELFAGLLAESELKDESRRWIEHVQAGLRSLSSTVNNVLDLHNEPSPSRARMDAGELLRWAYDFLLPLAHQARVDFEIVNGVEGVWIEADRHLLEQVLLNLALNALHFMPSGGWLAIRGVERGEEIEIEVQDTGAGISADDLTRIFDAGFTTTPGSTGLGLAVCQRILSQHGGTIAAESKAGQGATFRLRLPRIADGGTATTTRHAPYGIAGEVLPANQAENEIGL